jgi:transcriptional regulator
MENGSVEIQNLTRSCNEVLILATLERGPGHGYQLALEIEENSDGHFRFNHGTLYPILHRLEKEGLIRGDWDEDSPRRKRKFYELTEAGRSHLATELDSWRVFTNHFFAVAGGVK